MTDNIKRNNNQHNDANENEPKFDNIFNLSSETKEHLPVVTVSLKGGNKKTAMMVAGLTCLWGSGATSSTIKRKNAKYYKRRM